MAADERTMFEIYRESDYNRAFHCIFYTELDEHMRDAEITRASHGKTIYTGFVADARKEEARGVVLAIVDELNDMDEDENEDAAGLTPVEIERRLEEFLVAAPTP